MFNSFTLKNFRTHLDTTVELGPVTLITGPNNAGKSNLLAGINHLRWMAALGRPDREKGNFIGNYDFYPHCHSRHQDEPMRLACEWTHDLGRVQYAVELCPVQKGGRVVCSEEITWRLADGKKDSLKSGTGQGSNKLGLQSIAERNLSGDTRRLLSLFFRDLGGAYFFSFNTASLRRAAYDGEITPGEGMSRPSIAWSMRHNGERFQSVLRYLQQSEPDTFDAVVMWLRRFERSFILFHFVSAGTVEQRSVVQLPTGGETIQQNLIDGQPQGSGGAQEFVLRWAFETSREAARPDEFSTDVVSDGMLRGASIALLASMQRPPSLISVEEVENGISQRNLTRLIALLRVAAGHEKAVQRGYNTQFIITSHSPSTLREFADYVGHVYHIRLEQAGFKSVAVNLSNVLQSFVGIGMVSGDDLRNDGGEIKISAEKLLELWFSGAIRGEA